MARKSKGLRARLKREKKANDKSVTIISNPFRRVLAEFRDAGKGRYWITVLNKKRIDQALELAADFWDEEEE